MKAIGRIVTGVQGDAANLADLDQLYVTAARCKVSVFFPAAEMICHHKVQGVSFFPAAKMICHQASRHQASLRASPDGENLPKSRKVQGVVSFSGRRK